MFALTVLFVKLSIICMVKRVFGPAGKWVHTTSYITMAVTIIWGIYAFIVGIFFCIPLGSVWDGNPSSSCGSAMVAITAVGVIDIASELMIVALPLFLLGSLQMPLANKIGVYAVFGAGFMYVRWLPRFEPTDRSSTMAFTCADVYDAVTLKMHGHSPQSLAVSSISVVVQAGVAVMVASSAMLRPIFDRTILRCLGLRSPSTNQNASSGNVARSSAGIVPSRRPGLGQVSVSEECLAWEMGDMEGDDGSASTAKGSVSLTEHTAAQGGSVN